MKKLIVSILIASASIIAQDSHEHGVDQRGDHVMGFSHEKTMHHFRLLSDGGAIEVTAKEPADVESRDQARMHLSHIAKMFAEGNFQAPMQIHDRVPPGVLVLQELKKKVSYRYEDIDGGGRVRISTMNQKALSATHDFLRFQIADHRTGDSTTVAK
jgi:hypothetical protein